MHLFTSDETMCSQAESSIAVEMTGLLSAITAIPLEVGYFDLIASEINRYAATSERNIRIEKRMFTTVPLTELICG